jgi:EAL domain-containing protein (putative c-di-GMP-specific phosphodiesterase class I)
MVSVEPDCAIASDCLVCSIRSTGGHDSMYLYAPTEILSRRLHAILSASAFAFSTRTRTFAVDGAADRDAVLTVLRRELSQPEADDVRVTFDLANLMGAKSLTEIAHRADTAWFETALVEDRFTHWFQPIVDARRRTLFGHECLVRLPTGDPASPVLGGDAIIGAALSRGDLHVFDSYSRRTAIRNAARRHTAGRVFINFMPSSIYDPAFCMASTLAAMAGTHLTPTDIVFEVVESERVSEPRHLRKIADFYRDKGFSIALDDVGTGSNSLPMIADIRPDFIKLDKSIVAHCDSRIGRTTIAKLAEIGADTGIAVIAEGVETVRMRDALLACGISLMQGYAFAKPGPTMFDAFPDS